MQHITLEGAVNRALRALSVIVVIACAPSARAADAAFTQFIASLWPEAQAAGVSRATFEAETRGLEPDTNLPDLILPGRPATGAAGAGRVRAGAGRLPEGSEHRAARRRGTAVAAKIPRAL